MRAFHLPSYSNGMFNLSLKTVPQTAAMTAHTGHASDAKCKERKAPSSQNRRLPTELLVAIADQVSAPSSRARYTRLNRDILML